MKPEDDRQCFPELGSKIPRTFTKDHEPVKTEKGEMVILPPNFPFVIQAIDNIVMIIWRCKVRSCLETKSCDVNARKQGWEL